MINRGWIAFLFLWVTAWQPVVAQVKDAGLWLSVDVEKKITPAFSASLTEEVRMNENVTEVGSLLTDLGLKYRFGERFKAGVSYRFTKKRLLDDSYSTFHSWYVDFTYREKLKPIQLLVRVRYQSKYTEPQTSDDASIPTDRTRLKLTLKYDLNSDFEPYFYAESFFNFTTPVYSPFNEMRWCAGVEYHFNRMHGVDLHYMISKEYNVRRPETNFVIGIGYSLTF
jgi:hypothetical protein